jgi:ligand-binding sensor domain-containing protein
MKIVNGIHSKLKKIHFVFVLFSTLTTHGQNTIGLPQIINYTKNDFKGGLQTWDIEQGSNGQMFFANNEGLISFDGKYWKNYPLPNKTILRSIALDQNHNIYSGGQGEIGYFSPDNHGFLKYTSLTPLLPPNERNFADIWDIEVLGSSVFFRAGDRKIFELRNNTFSIYNPVSEWLFMKSVDGKLYAQDRTEGLLTFKGNIWRPIANAKLIVNESLAGLVKHKNGDYIAHTFKNKTFIIRQDTLLQQTSPPISEGGNIFKTTTVDQDVYALATTTQGCLIVNDQGKLIQRISRLEGLQNNSVLCLFLDKSKNLWAGLNNGISFIAYNAPIKYITPNKLNELSGFTTNIFKNKMYIGSSEGAYVLPITDPIQDLSFLKGQFQLVTNSSGQVWRLNEVNQMLLMAHTNGCFVIKDNNAVQISSDPGWLFTPLSQVVPSKQILVGTYMGLKMIDYENNNFKDLGNLKGIFESFRFLAIDNKNRIWASHPYRGIYLLTLSEDGTKYDSKLYTDKNGLPAQINNHVFKISNRIIFATTKGPYEFDEKTNSFKPSPYLKNYLGDTELRYLNEDEEGNIWFCSGKKIGVINFNKKLGKLEDKPIYFPELNGQILSGFENVYPFNKQNIFIASDKGIIHLNYEKYRNTRTKPTIILSQVRTIGEADSALYAGYGPINRSHNQTKKVAVSLPNNFNSFHFEYSSPAYGVQNNIEYSFILQGYDKNWSGWTIKQEKEYTNLPHGSYTFMVKSRDNLGNESDISSYSFTIAAPWYKTYWAYFFYAIFFLLITYLTNKWQKRKIDQQRLRFEEEQKKIYILHQLEIEKNEKEIIQLKNEKLQNDILLKTRELADTSLHLAERSEALLKVKDELQKLYIKTGDNHDIRKTLHLLHDIEKNNNNWEIFAKHFDEVSNDFLKKMKLKFPTLTNNDLKICAYLQLNLSSKEISQLMNISVRGVEINRYRLRKKLNITGNQSFNTFFNEQIRG